ncbi:zf-HC2 domain-containing protein [Lysinibacillus xylanilyticus]|uniref:zf-HC2 domain-containing protein n=1 Tax=Lysinibacillus xylanilyticus TaxID=582475 RepID=UPI002B252690|nr:zf-HC2 domain-containing protein [Lysinibacillus xylanilyticus]MEB2280515.1 zf-HC2 domain-containing protein [Lysinibacillus xylanilyticus]
MKEIKCTIIQDFLPLYVDDVVSEDTKELVEQHLQTCQACQKEYQQMTQTLYVPIENKATLFEKINKKWNRKKMILIGSSILTTLLLCLAVFSYVFYYEKMIPYSNDLFEIEEQEDQTLVATYFGKSHAGTHMTHPMKVEIDGEMKNISLIYYVETMANSPTSNFLQKDQRKDPERLELPDSKTVDEVYYGQFDLEKIIITKEQTWDELLQEMTLIWER